MDESYKVKSFTYLKEAADRPYEGIISVWVKAPEIAKTAYPGQFVHVLPRGFTLRRPISICDIENDNLRFVMDIVGEGTREIARQIEVEGSLNIIGPQGKGFSLSNSENPLLIGGGIGVFPLLYLAKKLKNPTIALGFRSENHVVMKEEFEAVGSTTIVVGGYVTGTAKDIPADQIYACGPRPMLEAVAEMAKSRNIPCEISMEERMACGIGACVGCVTPMVDGSYKRVCKDGPVFDASEVAL